MLPAVGDQMSDEMVCYLQADFMFYGLVSLLVCISVLCVVVCAVVILKGKA